MIDDLLHTEPARPADFLSSGILVVERDDSSADMMQRFLKSAGYRNTLAVVGSGSAIDLLYELDIDLLLIDSEVLTTIDERDILDQLRRSHVHKHLPVIVLTADTDRQIRLKVLGQGATDILSKPVDAIEMTLRLQNALAAKAYRDLVVFRDDLTGLPNRERYTDRLDWAIKHSLRYGQQGAVLHIDLDRFKKIVEGLGWATGDRLLRAVSKRIASCVRDTDVIAQQDIREQSVMLSRLSGNEFTVLLCGIDRPDSAAVVAQRIVDMLREPITLNAQTLNTSCSIGIAVFPADGRNTNDIISAANNAMHDIKRAGGNGFRFFTPGFNDRASQRFNMEADLRRALVESQIYLAYQPKIDLETGAICGAEALLRWRHPTRGMISPADFIPIAEESAIIHPLGDLVIEQACRQIRAWLDAGLNVPRIALNISALQFKRKEFVDELSYALAQHRLDGRHICIELTESVIMGNEEAQIRALDLLRELGVELSIDDFGTGYSSLAYLKRLPLHELKIDRSFLSTVEHDADSAAIVTAILSMGHRLGLRIVAEGVETRQQADFLREHHCDVCQGFLYSPAVPADEFALLLSNGIVLHD